MIGAALLVAGGLWLAGGRRQPSESGSPETATASPDSPDSATRIVVPEPDTVSVASGGGEAASVSITVSPSGPLPIGGSTRLAAEVRDQAGKPVSGASVRWLSSNPAAAAVDSATGQVQAVSPGSAQLVATSGAWRDSVLISIQGPSTQSGPPAGSRAPESLAITPLAGLRPGDTTSLGAVALDSKGRRIRAPRINWTSSDPSVAAVDSATGRLRTLAPGTALISARSGTKSATFDLEVLPAAVAAVSIEGRRPLKVGDSLLLRATTRDRHGAEIGGRRIAWASSDRAVMSIDSTSGVVHARAAGTAEITASSEGTSGRVNITVLPEPRTLRAEEPAPAGAPPSVASTSAQKAAQRQRALEQVGAGVDRCYGALQRKDVVQLAEMYDPQTKDDREKLKKLSRILRTDEWSAVVGPRVDGEPQIGATTAALEFNFPLSWKDAFGGRIKSRVVFRAEYAARGILWVMTGCRIVGSPKL